MQSQKAPERPLCATVGLAGDAFLSALDAALSGHGPALLPIDDQLGAPARAALLGALRPTAVRTPSGETPFPGGLGTDRSTALVVATSGSTGTPKGVELTSHALLASARASLKRINSPALSTWLCALPLSHVSGIQVLVRSLLSGTQPALFPRFSPEAALDAAHSGGAFISLVPTQLRRLVDLGADLSVFHTILLGGAPASSAVLDEARRLGARVTITYGMTETAGGCIYNGVPLDGFRVAIDPGDNRVLLAGPGLFSGYRLDPTRTRASLTPAGFRTDDTGALDPAGRLTVHGRLDDLVISGGKKIAPTKVAELIEAHPLVREAVVVGLPDDYWGQRVTAAVVPAHPCRPPSTSELRMWLRGRFASWAVPRDFAMLRELPQLPNGKTDMTALTALLGSRRPATAIPDGKVTRSAPRTVR